jgi:recombinational DNA repair ATPase RecF
LFDQRNLAEITSPDYPGERLVACRNDALAKLRAHKRESLLQATEAQLAQIKASVDAGRLTGQDKIGVQVGKIINRHKVAKHFELSIGDATLGLVAKARRH